MPTNPLREGFHEVVRDPALLLIEIGWRWTFGAIAILVLWLALFTALGSVPVDNRFLSTSNVVSFWETAQSLASTAISLGRALARVAITASLFLALCWIVLNSIGRHATLLRPALAPGASLRSCIAISVARAGISFAAVLAWILAFFAGSFLYIGASDLLPEAREHESPAVGFTTVLGMAAIFAITRALPR